MGVKQCGKCSEMVDEAKAFCPGCGNAFVEEESRDEASNFDSFEGTVQLGQTMYNQMLSDMGLNISKAPDPVEKGAEVTEPPAAPIQPVQPPPAIPQNAAPDRTKWWIIGGVAVGLVLIILVAAIVLIFTFWSRLTYSP